MSPPAFVKGLFRRLLAAILLAVVVYGAVVLWTGYQRLGSALVGFAWWTFGAAVGLSSINYGLRFLKWEFYLHRLRVRAIPKLDSLLIFLSGFVLTVTPGKIGEVFKSVVLERTHDVPLARTAPIVLAERLTDVIAIVILVALGSLGFSGGLIWAGLGLLVVILGMALILWPPIIESFLGYLESRGGKMASWTPSLRASHVSLRVVASPSALLAPTLLSLLGWGGEGLGLYLLLGGFEQGTSLPLSVFFYATATLAGALVPVPGGLGVAEGLMQSQLVELGQVTPGAATGAMLMIRVATLWWAVAVGFLALALLRLRYPQRLGTKELENATVSET